MIRVKVSGAWHNVQNPYVKVSGAWHNTQNVYVRVSGSWRALYKYAYVAGSFGGCSATCGGGTQYRSVTCYRYHDGIQQWAVTDDYCTRAGVSKPAASQGCNTQSCTQCWYKSNWKPYTTLYSIDDYVWIAPYQYSDSIYGGAAKGGVVWNTLVVSGMAYNTTYAAANGYSYTRSTLQKTGLFIVTDEMTSTFAAYIVCRTPV